MPVAAFRDELRRVPRAARARQSCDQSPREQRRPPQRARSAAICVQCRARAAGPNASRATRRTAARVQPFSEGRGERDAPCQKLGIIRIGCASPWRVSAGRAGRRFARRAAPARRAAKGWKKSAGSARDGLSRAGFIASMRRKTSFSAAGSPAAKAWPPGQAGDGEGLVLRRAFRDVDVEHHDVFRGQLLPDFLRHAAAEIDSSGRPR